MIGEKSAQNLFSNWTILLRELNAEKENRKKVIAALEKSLWSAAQQQNVEAKDREAVLNAQRAILAPTGQGSEGSASASAEASVFKLEQNFHFLAKYILMNAGFGTQLELDELKRFLRDEKPLPKIWPSNEKQLRDLLLSYAVRRVGIVVVGDPSFRTKGFVENQQRSGAQVSALGSESAPAGANAPSEGAPRNGGAPPAALAPVTPARATRPSASEENTAQSSDAQAPSDPQAAPQPAPGTPPAPVATPAPATPAPEAAPAPVATPAPGATPAPVATPAPGATPAPEATAAPAATPTPVATPAPPPSTEPLFKTEATIASRTLDQFVSMRLAQDVKKGTNVSRAVLEIKVEPRYTTLVAFDTGELERLRTGRCKLPDEALKSFYSSYSYVATYEEEKASGFFGGARKVDVYRAVADQELEADTVTPAEAIDPANLRLAFGPLAGSPQDMPPPPDEYKKCITVSKAIALPVGFFNFLARILDMQPYTYATLPRIDLRVVKSSDDLLKAGALSAGSEAGGLAGRHDTSFRRINQAVEAKTSIVGFSGWTCPGDKPAAPGSAGPARCVKSPPAGDELNFGWVLSPPADITLNGALKFRPMQPTQRSLSALITVPSWWRKASIEVTTGWLRANGEYRTETRQVETHRIPLPIDFESLDTILVGPGRRDSRRPSIALERLPERIEVQACEKAEILIPGNRLWRSTVVTLDGQRADEVAVLPDMRGIIATFDPVGARRPWEKEEASLRRLQIWTSEGAASFVNVWVRGEPASCSDGKRRKTVADSAQPETPAPGGGK